MLVLLWANEIFDHDNPDTYGMRYLDEKLKVITIVGTRPEIIDSPESYQN